MFNINAINWGDVAVQSAVITTVGGLLTAVIAATCAALIGAQVAGRKKLKEQLRVAAHDIAYLLAVEKAHTEIHKQAPEGKNLKLSVRRQVEKDDPSLSWSGKFVPSRTKHL